MIKNKVKLDSGNHELPLPLLDYSVKLPSSKPPDLNHMRTLKSKMKDEKCNDYKTFLHEMFDKNFAEKVPLYDLNNSKV